MSIATEIIQRIVLAADKVELTCSQLESFGRQLGLPMPIRESQEKDREVQSDGFVSITYVALSRVESAQDHLQHLMEALNTLFEDAGPGAVAPTRR